MARASVAGRVGTRRTGLAWIPRTGRLDRLHHWELPPCTAWVARYCDHCTVNSEVYQFHAWAAADLKAVSSAPQGHQIRARSYLNPHFRINRSWGALRSQGRPVAGAGGYRATFSGGSPPASGATTLTGTTGQATLPATCPNGNTLVQGVASLALMANGTPSIPGTSYPVTVTVVGPTHGAVASDVFAETNLQLMAASCSLRIGFFCGLCSVGPNGTQFSVATGRLLGGRRMLINYLAVRGSAGRLLALPVTSSVRCLSVPFVALAACRSGGAASCG